MGTYVVGDLRGCFKEWMAFKDAIERMDENADFILVGNILGEGEEAERLLKWCQANVRPTGRYQMVLGDREFETYYDHEGHVFDSMFTREPFYKDITVGGRRFIIAHADFHLTRVGDEIFVDDMECLYCRDKKPFDIIPGAVLVHGHSPTIYEYSFREGDFCEERLGRVYDMGNRYNIDCGMGYDHPESRLVAMRLDDMKIFYNDEMNET